jgi:hypothetical protein
MPTVQECQNKVLYLFDAIIEVSHAMRVIDQHAVETWKSKPAECVPDLFREQEVSAPLPKCQIIDVVGEENIEHRKFAKKKLLTLKHEMILPLEFKEGGILGENKYVNDYEFVVQSLEDSIGMIDVNKKDSLDITPGLNELVSDLEYRLLLAFDSCMRAQ